MTQMTARYFNESIATRTAWTQDGPMLWQIRPVAHWVTVRRTK